MPSVCCWVERCYDLARFVMLPAPVRVRDTAFLLNSCADVYGSPAGMIGKLTVAINSP